MKNRKLATLLATVLLIRVNPGAFAAGQPEQKGGPIFTIPKTVIALDMQIDKTAQSQPGTNCEFIDLFFPGLDTAVSCNGNILPPLELGVIDKPGTEIDKDLAKALRVDRLKLLADKRAIAKRQEKLQSDADDAVSELEKSPAFPDQAAAIETPLKQAVDAASADLKAKTVTLTKMEADRKAAKAEAKKKPHRSVEEYLKGLRDEVKAAQDTLTERQAGLAAKAAEIAKLRGPLAAACDGDSMPKPDKCRNLTEARAKAEQAAKVADLAARDASRPDRRAAHPFSVTRIKSFSVSTRGIPDPERAQDLPYASGFFKDSEQTFTLEEGGTLQGLKSTTTDHKAEFFFGLLKAASGIASRLLTGAGDAAMNAVSAKPPVDSKNLTDEEKFIAFLRKDAGSYQNGLESNFRLLPDERRKQYVEGLIRKPVDTPNVVTALSLAKRSYLDLADLQQGYLTLLGGNSTAAGVSSVLDANRKMFDTLLSNGWTGNSQVVSWTPTYEVTPNNPANPGSDPVDPNRLAAGQPVFLFKIAASCGVDTSGKVLLPVKGPQPKSVACRSGDPEDEKPEFKEVTLTVNTVPGPSISSWAAARPSQPTAGLPFVIPGDSIVSIANTGIRLVDPHALLAQWGHVAFLPLSLFNSSGGVETTYYQATGALKSITQKTPAKATGATADTIGAAILAPLDAKLTANAKADTERKADEAQKEADAKADAKAAADELAKWTRLKDTLEARKAAEALCKELGISPCQ